MGTGPNPSSTLRHFNSQRLIALGVALMVLVSLVAFVWCLVEIVSPPAGRWPVATPTPGTPTLPAPGRAGPDWGTELLASMTGTVRAREGEIEVLKEPDRLTTADRYHPPVFFHVAAMTDSTNIRIAFAGARQIIFNWEVNPNQLRVDGGPADGRHKRGAGRIPVGQWVDIGIELQNEYLVLTVNGAQRYMTIANFSKIDEPLTIFPANGSTIKVRSVRVQQN